MSDQRSEQPTVLEPTDERVLLLVAGERDRGLLADRLAERYEVVDGDTDDVGEFDLCIVDARTYRQVAEELSTLKRAVDTYLPVLVLVEDREQFRDEPPPPGHVSRVALAVDGPDDSAGGRVWRGESRRFGPACRPDTRKSASGWGSSPRSRAPSARSYRPDSASR